MVRASVAEKLVMWANVGFQVGFYNHGTLVAVRPWDAAEPVAALTGS